MISTFDQLAIGFRSYNKAVNIIFSQKLLKYFIIPVILNLAFFYLAWYTGGKLVDYTLDHIKQWLNFSEFWNSFLEGLVMVLVRLLVIVVFIFLGGFIIIMLMTPIYAVLSEKTEFYYNKKTYNVTVKQFLRDIVRGLTLALRNMGIEVLFTIILFTAGLIPVIGWFSPIVLFFISSYFFGFSFMDFSNERLGRNRQQSITFTRKYKWVAIANGSVYALLLLTFCGTALAAFTGGVSTVAATISMLEIEQIENKLKH